MDVGSLYSAWLFTMWWTLRKCYTITGQQFQLNGKLCVQLRLFSRLNVLNLIRGRFPYFCGSFFSMWCVNECICHPLIYTFEFLTIEKQSNYVIIFCLNKSFTRIYRRLEFSRFRRSSFGTLMTFHEYCKINGLSNNDDMIWTRRITRKNHTFY